ncbi:MAG: 16S rRNA pseudouridine synthase, partial [Marinobacter sp. T13-3]
MKLSRILSNQNGISRKQANALIATGRVSVNDQVCRMPAHEVDRFSTVRLHGEIIQAGETELYLMLNKPAGYLSATVDASHQTVLELVAPELRQHLHIAGRLDRSSTGLLILTSNGHWSRKLTEPAVKIPKVYRVTTAYPIGPDTEEQ